MEQGGRGLLMPVHVHLRLLKALIVAEGTLWGF